MFTYDDAGSIIGYLNVCYLSNTNSIKKVS